MAQVSNSMAPHNFYRDPDNDCAISVVVPVYNEADVLPEFHRRMMHVITEMGLSTELLYVNDGSSDSSDELIESFRNKDKCVVVLGLSRNFGKEIALSAGLDYAKGSAVIVIDVDLQDPPELIPKLVEEWKKGYDVVYAKRISRDGETSIKRLTAHSFYRLMQKFGDVKIPEDTGDFRLLSRRAVEALKCMSERHRFMKGLFTWIGYSQKEVLFRRERRHKGKTKWNYWRLFNLAIEGITSFTIIPLRFASYLGILTAITAFLYAIFVVYKTIVFGDPVKGYPSLMVVILFLAGVQLIALGVIGEYIGRIFNETKNRPLYFIKKYTEGRTGRDIE